MSIKEDSVMKYKQFKDINLSDPFFGSLKEDYKEFESWFKRKSDEFAYVTYDDDNTIHGFLYIKEENGPITDITPALNVGRCLKVGTFKIEAHGTKLGERFIKKIFDYAVDREIRDIYVTIFEKHDSLINLLKTFGFLLYAEKKTSNGKELVYHKKIFENISDVLLNYPMVDLNKNKYLLSIFPEYHTKLFPDSILKNENSNIVQDLSSTNSIRKVYLSRAMDTQDLQKGDIIIIYRTAEEGKPAEYSSVATSLCVVEEIKTKYDFRSLTELKEYCMERSVLSDKEFLYYLNGRDMTVIKMTYNIAFKKRPIRKYLIENIGLDRYKRWTFLQLTDKQFIDILKAGEVYESIIFN